MRVFLTVVILMVAGAAMADPEEEQFRARFAELAGKFRIPGMAVGYVQMGEPAVIAAEGLLYKGSERPVAPDSLWHIGSITKSFTATMIMRLSEGGVLSVDATLAELLPEYADEMHADWRDVTMAGLLSHSARLPANFSRSEMKADYDPNLTEARLHLLRGHWGKPLPGKPGSYTYSNMGYVLAGFVAETRTGKPWQTLIREEIAEPLGLSSIGFGPPTGPDAPRGHRGWLLMKRAIDPSERWSDNPPWLGPAGTIHLTLADLLAWGQVQIRACRGEMPEFQSVASCERLHTPILQDYAFGWSVLKLPGLDQPVLNHDGSNTMWYASLTISKDRDTVMALVMNQASAIKSARILQNLSKIVLDLE